MCSLICYCLLLFVPCLFFLRLVRAVLRDCGISWVSSLIFWHKLSHILYKVPVRKKIYYLSNLSFSKAFWINSVISATFTTAIFEHLKTCNMVTHLYTKGLLRRRFDDHCGIIFSISP